MNNQITTKLTPSTASQLTVSKTGTLICSNGDQLMEMARIMADSGVAIPKHLRENPGACLAVLIQAMEWEMSSFAVANKSYSVNDRLAYEAQMINAVILRRAPIVGRFKVSYGGEGNSRTCTVSARLTDGEEVEYTSPPLATIKVKNSPLWAGDPDQQLFYYSSRAMCRRHFPDVLLGIYTQDEMAESLPRDVTPVSSPPPVPTFTAPALVEAAVEVAAVVAPEAAEVAPPEPPAVVPLTADDLKKWMAHDQVSVPEMRACLYDRQMLKSKTMTLSSLTPEALAVINEQWSDVLDDIRAARSTATPTT